MNSKFHYILLLLISVFGYNITFSQTTIRDNNTKFVNYGNDINKPLSASELAMIVEAYGDKTQAYVLDRPQRLRDIKHILRNRFSIEYIPNERNQKTCPLLSEVPLMDYYVQNLERDVNFNPEDFNPLKYLFQFYASGTKIYRVDNTDYFIYIKSQHSN